MSEGTYTATKSEYETIPTGEYLFQVVDWSETTGNYGQQIEFTFEIMAPKEYAGKQRKGWCSAKMTTSPRGNSKLWDWTEAIYNRKVAEGEEVNLNNLIGRRAVGVVVCEKSKATDDGEVSKITSLKPYKKQEPFDGAKAGEFEVGEPEDADPFEKE